LGFRFDVDALIAGGIAHRAGCVLAPAAVALGVVRLAAGEVYRSQRCPLTCSRCRPPFETLLGYQLEPIGRA
jgi:hypothetical protein